MFVTDPSRTSIDPQGPIVTLVESINQPLVAVPGKPSQPAQAVVCGLQQGAQFEVLVFLHLLVDNEGVLYSWDAGPVSVDAFRAVEAEAVSFVESMGFMVDSLNWAGMDQAQRAETLARLGAFHADLSAFRQQGAEEGGGAAEQVDPKLLDLARLMAAF